MDPTGTNNAPLDAGNPAPGQVQESRSGFSLKSLFNKKALAKVALGAAFGIAAKATLGAVIIAAPPIALAIAGGAIGSFVTNAVMHAAKNHSLEKSGKEKVKFDWMRDGVGSLVLGALGGAIGGFLSDLIGNFTDAFKGGGSVLDAATNAPAAEAAASTPAAPVAATPAPAAEIAAPVAESAQGPVGLCLADDVKALVNADGVSDAVRDAASRACSDNATVAAQGTKDLGFHAYNGIGMEKSPVVGYGLFEKAAEAGNVQALRDLATIQFTGDEVVGVEQNPDAALEKLGALAPQDNTGLAGRLAEQWTPASDPEAEEITRRLNLDTPIRETVEPLATPAVATPAPAAVTPAQIVESATMEATAGPEYAAVPAVNAEDCKAVFHDNGIDFDCPVNANPFTVGQTVSAVRPPLLTPMMVR